LKAVAQIETASGAVLKARSIIIATGAKWRNMNVPGEDQYRTKGVTYCPHCDGPLFKGKRVAVIGGGNSGVEAAIDLAGIVEHVTLLEFAPEMKADQVLQDKVRSLKNVDIILNAQTTEVKGDGSKVTGLEYRDRVSGDVHSVRCRGSSCRLVCCQTPPGWKARLSATAWAKSSSMRNVKPA
jgi:alkyl hydroperoxide reductase subunit F